MATYQGPLPRDAVEQEQTFREIGLTPYLPGYIRGATTQTEAPGDYEPVPVTDPFAFETDAFTPQSDLRAALRVPEENLELYPNAARVAKQGLRSGSIFEPGWRPQTSAPSTSRGGGGAGSGGSGGPLGAVRGSLAGAGGAVAAVAAGLLIAFLWVIFDG